jgi:predicted negative regulator of RcsB-dependent stress response
MSDSEQKARLQEADKLFEQGKFAEASALYEQGLTAQSDPDI